MLNVVLHEPQIPQNTGNIVRTCAIFGLKLHLIKPLGFTIDDKSLKRAGLDYWQNVAITCYDSFEIFLEKNLPARIFCATTKAVKKYTDFSFKEGDFFIFGKETKGLPSYILQQYKDFLIRIPMKITSRSLNLSNAVAIVLSEALRQLNFPQLY